MRFPSRQIVESLRKQYPNGTRVELVQMDDAQAPPIGTQVSWDNGSGLNVIYGEDVVRKV